MLDRRQERTVMMDENTPMDVEWISRHSELTKARYRAVWSTTDQLGIGSG